MLSNDTVNNTRRKVSTLLPLSPQTSMDRSRSVSTRTFGPEVKSQDTNKTVGYTGELNI